MGEAALALQKGPDITVEAALGIFRELLPDSGFRLVMPPPGTGGAPRAFASAWRSGQAQAASCAGATPALALLRAAETELAKLRDAAALSACGHCRGVGWFVTTDGMIEICRGGEK